MYLRHSRIRKNGKTHIYWRLVRSVRNGTRIRQETVAQLGELDKAGRIEARALARRITGKEWGRDLFEPDEPLETVRVRFKNLRLERGRRFGDVWMGHLLWQATGLDELLGRLIPEGLEDVPWSKMAAVQVIARLCEPSSDLHIAEDCICVNLRESQGETKNPRWQGL